MAFDSVDVASKTQQDDQVENERDRRGDEHLGHVIIIDRWQIDAYALPKDTREQHG